MGWHVDVDVHKDRREESPIGMHGPGTLVSQVGPLFWGDKYRDHGETLVETRARASRTGLRPSEYQSSCNGMY